MAKLNKSYFAILGVLALEPNSSGYGIKKIIEQSTQFFWKETPGSIYPNLKKLEKEGLVTQKSSPSQGGRERNLYSLTDKGGEEWKKWLATPVDPMQYRNELLLKIFFGGFCAPSISYKNIETFRNELIQKIEIYSQAKKRILGGQSNDSGLPYWLMTVEFGLKQAESALEWCEASLLQIGKTL